MIEKRICDLLVKEGLCDSEEAFSRIFLGRCNSYFSSMKSQRKGISIGAKVTLKERLKIHSEMTEQTGRKRLANDLLKYAVMLDAEIGQDCL